MSNKKSGVELIAEERQRQIEKEKWTPQHDQEEHKDGELAVAAGCYAFACIYGPDTQAGILTPDFWPWDEDWWKPTPNDRIRELSKAGALIAAEIDRLQNI